MANSRRVGPLIKLCVSGIKQINDLQVAIPACGLLAAITFLQFAPNTNMELAEKAGAIKAIVQLLSSLHQPNTQSDTTQQRQMKQMFGFAMFEGLKTLNNLVARSENRCRSAVQHGAMQLVTALLLPAAWSQPHACAAWSQPHACAAWSQPHACAAWSQPHACAAQHSWC